MQPAAEFPVILALLSGPEVVCILGIILLLAARRVWPDLSEGLRRGRFELRSALEDEARAAGQSLGANFGKPALDALTHDNRTVEFHELSSFRPVIFRRWKKVTKLFRRIRMAVTAFVRLFTRG
jgi:hypothetical protein